MAERLHRLGHSAYPLQKIEIVRALVEKNAAALSRPRRAPVAAVIIILRAVPVGYDPVDALDIADIAAVNHLFHFAENAVCALIEHHRKCLILLFCKLVHFADMLCVYARRLFAHNMPAVCKRLHYKARMIIMRNCNDDSVDIRATAQRRARHPSFGKLFSVR